ncbi:MAG: beta-ketoacyl synthase chain length factor [Gammaproteobacteria bacterium]|nr:beta-ketoacyl synthase chain length factor [Gammaproteobacteria bacterium]
MAKVSFSLDSWSAWSSSMRNSSDWIDWANNKDFIPSSTPLDISMVPAMKRRRMSNLTKMAFATALDCTKNTELTPICVFASQHGELTKTVKILNTLVTEEDVSPTDFSLSVNNTALGLYSIFTDNKKPATTVAAGEDTFGFALLEACIYMSRFPEQPVLLIFFDEPLPSPLSEFKNNPYEAFSIALLLSFSGKSNISMNFEYNDAEITDGLNHGAEFLKFYLSDNKTGLTTSSRISWNWNKLY